VETKGEKRVAKWVVHGNIVVYAFAFWLCQPILPHLSSELGADDVTYGYLQAVFSFCQFVGGPLMGVVMDAFGPRMALILSQGAGAVGYGLIARATTLPLLFLSRVPQLFMHSMHAAQTSITHLSTEANRSAELGRLSLFYGLGLLFAPSLGGYLSEHYGSSLVASISAACSLTCAVLTALFLADTRRFAVDSGKKKDDSDAAGGEGGGKLRLGAIVELLQVRTVRDALIMKLTVGLAVSMVQTSLLLYLKAEGFSKQDTGVFLSYAGFIAVLSNALIIPYITKTFASSDQGLLLGAIITISLCYVTLPFLPAHPASNYAFITPVAASSSGMYTVTTSLLTRSTPKHQAGTVIGLAHGTRTLCSMTGPVLAGLLSSSYGYDAVFFVSSALCLLGLAPALLLPIS